MNKLLHFILFGVLLFVCGSCDDPSPTSKKEKGTLTYIDGYPDNGDFRPIYQLFVGKSDAKTVIDQLHRDKTVDDILSQLNSIFKLPQDVIIRFDYSNVANAWYDPATKSIDFTSAFIIDFYNKLSRYYRGQELINHVTNVVIFFLFHEIGHALTDIYQLSVKGPEEDMADYFSIFLLSQGDDVIQQGALDGADMFYEYSRPAANQTINTLPLWDEHSLDQQRYYNILCLMYGSNTVKYNYFITNKLLPSQMADRCISEYPRVIKSWQNDLSRFMHTR